MLPAREESRYDHAHNAGLFVGNAGSGRGATQVDNHIDIVGKLFGGGVAR